MQISQESGHGGIEDGEELRRPGASVAVAIPSVQLDFYEPDAMFD